MRIGMALLSFILLSGCTALVMGGSESGGYQTSKDEREPAVLRSDSAISANVKGLFGEDPVVNKFNIGVRTYNGTVTITGTVDDFVARDQAGKIAKNADGVVIVNNQIVVED